jgi:hypothetical protein
MRGFLEAVSPAFANGWAGYVGGAPAYVHAVLDGEILGAARANGERPDLMEAAARENFSAGAYMILFNRTSPPEQQARVQIHAINQDGPLPRLPDLQTDIWPIRQIFILGSPRCGTSELGATLVREFSLRWTGEFHTAPRFAGLAALLEPGAGDEAVAHVSNCGRPIDALREQARLTYYAVHGSASFLDKSPGVAMIRAAPFLAGCFETGKFIHLRRNGVSNVLSRIAKFGGSFDEHCADWAAAMQEWARVREQLPHYLDIAQEDMQDQPDATAAAIATYLDAPSHAARIADQLRAGRREHTGAGVGRTRLADTGWTPEERAIFLRICGPTMRRYGYGW